MPINNSTNKYTNSRASSVRYDSVRLVTSVANLEFIVTSVNGNITVV